MVESQHLVPFRRLAFNLVAAGGSWCGPYKTWQRSYNYDITYSLTEEEAGLVMRGEVCFWSEQAGETVLLWSCASALAESLWSGNQRRAALSMLFIASMIGATTWFLRASRPCLFSPYGARNIPVNVIRLFALMN
ncbi:hypothetical protein GOP47_0006779 [Adiantum capillus-veneris]|uniref:beta-N-acetylhexosaminidase n=1 Tax=Adiantum capillus-veneris TaxID=13818 RepID=A0A9D4V3Q9_ADICA|nr:hypothetical protein GOP47_0006779 [Adiantum capillus-veneris]